MLGNSSYVKGPPIHVRRKSKYDQQRTLLVFDKKKKKKKKKKGKKVRKSNSIFERERERKKRKIETLLTVIFVKDRRIVYGLILMKF
jgi:hypothetical protein